MKLIPPLYIGPCEAMLKACANHQHSGKITQTDQNLAFQIQKPFWHNHGLIPVGGRNLFNHKEGSTAHSFSLTPSHHPDDWNAVAKAEKS